MTGAFFYKPGPAGTGWELLAGPEVKTRLLSLTKTLLVSDSFPAGRTAIGHIARNGDYVVIVHKDRRFAGRLIGAHAYEAYGFDPFAVVAELPAADAALRAAVDWGNALTETAASVVAAEATGDDTVLWQAPTDMLAVALARALFLSGAPGQRRADYFSLSLQDLPYQRSVLTRLADHDGQQPPPALLAAARALPDAAVEALSVTLALPSATPSEQREQTEAWTSVRKSVSPSPSPVQSATPSAPPPRHDAGAAAAAAQEGTMPPQSDTPLPIAETDAHGRAPRFSAVPWWLSPTATAAVALLFIAWIGNETTLLRTEAAVARKEINELATNVEEAVGSAATSAKQEVDSAKDEALRKINELGTGVETAVGSAAMSAKQEVDSAKKEALRKINELGTGVETAVGSAAMSAWTAVDSAKQKALQEINELGTGVETAVGSAENSAKDELNSAKKEALRKINELGTGVETAVGSAAMSAWTAVDSAKQKALQEINELGTGVETAVGSAENSAKDELNSAKKEPESAKKELDKRQEGAGERQAEGASGD